MRNELINYGIVEEHAPLKNHNTYRIETTTRYLLHPLTEEKVASFIKYAEQENIPYFILGNGSNVILSDTEYPGVVVKLDQLKNILYEGNQVTVDAGVMINKLSFDILKHGLCGLEWANGIPGTIGGCIFGNAEAYKVSTFDYLKSVTFLNQERKIITLEKEFLTHGYRTSYFKENPENIILKAEFEFPSGKKEESLEIIKNRTERRLNSQPLNYPSAGSVFRNPSPDMPSGKLIDDLGLKGFQIGHAVVSEKHANFILNVGKATGKDIRNLIELIHNQVMEKYAIDLVLEQEYKNW